MSRLRQFLNTPSLWLALAIVLLAETFVRVSIPTGKLARGAYHSSEYRQQVEQYQKSVPVDMMIVGSSVAAANYPPLPLDERIRELGYNGFTTYNAGIRGCTYACIAKSTYLNYLSQFRPPIVMLVINPVDLDTNDTFVAARSERFVADMERGTIARHARQTLARFSVLYGFSEEARKWLRSGEWEFDPAVVRDRGYVDMGSEMRTSHPFVPVIEPESDITMALTELVRKLTTSGTRVILLTAEGNTLARSIFPDQAKRHYWQLLDELSRYPDVFLLTGTDAHISDSSYIDNIHLSSTSAAENARTVAERLVKDGLIKIAY